MMKTVYHMRSCIENTVQLRNAVFYMELLHLTEQQKENVYVLKEAYGDKIS